MTTLSTDAESRIRALNTDAWIGYPRALAIRNELEELLMVPRKLRMPGLSIIGETNNGKTMLLNQFYDRHAPPDDPTIVATKVPVVLIQMPTSPDPATFYNAILEPFFAAGPIREPSSVKFQRLKTLARGLDTKMLIIDEFHHALATSSKRQERLLNEIKYLMNELQIVVVAAGTPAARNAIASDPQIRNRLIPRELPRWELNREYLQLLASLELTLKLEKPSGLSKMEMAKAILLQTEGTIGEIVTLLKSLTRLAIQSGQEQITLDMLSGNSLSKLGWVRPSERSMRFG